MPQGLVLLRSDNFTSPERTPWGGTKIVGRYKQRALLAPEMASLPVVGESWELSVEPAYPSECEETHEPLRDVLRRDASAMLGEEARAGRDETALLVKLLDAGDALSVQVHPADDYAGLSEGESGKPECWYVLEREPGAGLYFGLRPGVTRAELEEVVRSHRDPTALLCFVPVEPGDFFVIDPGTVHAVGGGITLVEPQHVVPGCEGVTYRLSTWGRPGRALQIDDALAVTDWARPMDGRRLGEVRACFGPAEPAGPARLDVLCGDVGGIASSTLRAARLHGTGGVALPAWDALRALTVVGGRVRVGELGWLGIGQTVAVGACRGAMEVELDGAHAIVSAVRCPGS